MKHKSKTKLSTALLFSGVLVLSQQAAAETLKWAGCGISKKAYMAEIAKTFKNETGNKVLLLARIFHSSFSNPQFSGACSSAT